MYDLVIEGTVVDPFTGLKETKIGIKGEKIEAVGSGLDGSRMISVDGLIFPGFIDPHVHLRDFDWKPKEDYTSGTQAALNGGVTTVADMPNLPRPTTSKERILEKIEHARANARADVLVYGGVCIENIDRLEEMSDLVCGYKIFTCESTGKLYLPIEYLGKALKRIECTNRPVTIHCEDQTIIDKLSSMAVYWDYPNAHCDSRPVYSETSAIRSVLAEASDFKGKLNIAHISTAVGLGLKKHYSMRHENVTCEVTPHHLHFTSDDMWQTDHAPVILKVNPPIRHGADIAALLTGLKNGDIEMFATDHAPHTMAEKLSEKPPSGMPGLDDYGRFIAYLIKEKNVDPKTIANVCSYNPARFFGLEQRGRITEGYIADMTVINFDEKPNKNRRIYTKCNWSPYERSKFPGDVSYVIRRGEIVKTPKGLLI